jgi:hypothetical protein
MADFEEKFSKNRKPQSKKSAKGGSSSASGRMRGLPKDSPQVKLSKTITWLLRHGANREGLSIRPDGYILVEEIVCIILALPEIYLISMHPPGGKSEGEGRDPGPGGSKRDRRE